jgi:Domain of unknown function (DUF378)
VKPLNIFTAILLIIGGLNWGLVAIAEFDLVATVFGLAFGDTNLASRNRLRAGWAVRALLRRPSCRPHCASGALPPRPSATNEAAR